MSHGWKTVVGVGHSTSSPLISSALGGARLRIMVTFFGLLKDGRRMDGTGGKWKDGKEGKRTKLRISEKKLNQWRTTLTKAGTLQTNRSTKNSTIR
jgi:hypothetical protein